MSNTNQFPEEPVFGSDHLYFKKDCNAFQKKMQEMYLEVQPGKNEEQKSMSEASKSVENNYNSDSLTMSQIKNIMEQKDDFKERQSDYKYEEEFGIAQEIDEFFSYTELTRHIDNQKTFQEVTGDWSSNSPEECVTILQIWLESLEHADRNRRFRSSQCLLYFAQGQFGDCEKPSEHYDKLIKNNILLKKLGAAQFYYEAIKMTCVHHDKLVELFLSGANIETSQMNEINLELSIQLSLMYLLIEVNRPRGKSPNKDANLFLEEIASLEPRVCPFLFGLISKLKEKSFKGYPIKKVLILLWKIFLMIYGDIDSYKDLIEFQRMDYNLPPKPSPGEPRVGPEEYNLFHYTFAKKFPSCFTNFENSYFTTPPTFSKWSFHSPRSSHINVLESKSFLYNDQISSEYPSLLPVTKNHAIVPKPIQEAADLFTDHLYFSLSYVQLLETTIKLYDLNLDPETSLPPNLVFKKSNKKEIRSNIHSEINLDGDRTPTLSLKEVHLESNDKQSYYQTRLNRIEELYIDLLPESHSLVVVLLKLLLATVPPPRPVTEKLDSNPFGTKDGNLVPPFDTPIHLSADEIDDIRHKEIVAKAISSIILLLLKAFKSNHIIKFEYYAQMLSDSNAVLLILKLYGLQDFITFAKIRNECDHLCFFKALLRPSMKAKDTENDTSVQKASIPATFKLPFPSGRNIYTAITFFRILHQITKDKLSRIATLVQFKSTAILKRVLKIGHPKLSQYILKIFKSQIPFLGRKWKQNNMKIITLIFLNTTRGLIEDWALPYDFAQNIDQQSLAIKDLINGYHQMEYTDYEYHYLLKNEMNNNSNNKQESVPEPITPVRSYSAHDTSTSNNNQQQNKAVYHSKSVNSLSKYNINKYNNEQQNYYTGDDSSYLSNRLDLLKLTNLAAHSGYGSSSFDLDDDFRTNYEEWLEFEVFNQPNTTITTDKDSPILTSKSNTSNFIDQRYSQDCNSDEEEDSNSKPESKIKAPLSPPLY